MAPAGRLADAAGRKLIYLYGFVVFTGASAVCGLVPTLGLLVAFRVVQAVGAAMLQANSVALVVTSVPGRGCGRRSGYRRPPRPSAWRSGRRRAGCLWPPVGWRWVFWINVPVGCVAFAAATSCREPVRAARQRDSIGPGSR